MYLQPTYSGRQDPRLALDSSRPHRHSDLTACKALPSLPSPPTPHHFLAFAVSGSLFFSLWI